MPNAKIMIAAVAMMCCVPLAAIAEQSEMPEGTWVIDAIQTAEFLKKVGPPINHAESLPRVLLSMCVTTMTFSGNTLTKTSIGPFSTAESFRLSPQQEGKLKYRLETKEGDVKDTIAISFMKEGSMIIKSSKMELMEYGVWTQGKSSTPKTGEKDFSQAFQACAAALKNVPFLNGR